MSRLLRGVSFYALSKDTLLGRLSGPSRITTLPLAPIAFTRVRAVATAILAGVIAQILVFPPGALASVPGFLRYSAVAAGLRPRDIVTPASLRYRTLVPRADLSVDARSGSRGDMPRCGEG